MAVSPSPTVFLIDDDTPVRDALSRLLRAHRFALAAFGSPKEFLEHYNPNTPGCLVLDLKMRGNGFGLQRTLQERGSPLPIIFITGHGDIPKSVQALKGGAVDFLTKPVNDKDLLAAVRVAIEKDRTLRQEQAEVSEIRTRLSMLTPREREVLEHVVAGNLNKQIASDLSITEATVKMHRARVMAKMKVQTVADLVRLAGRCGIRGR
jgi:FixJ family two-component response regulator